MLFELVAFLPSFNHYPPLISNMLSRFIQGTIEAIAGILESQMLHKR